MSGYRIWIGATKDDIVIGARTVREAWEAGILTDYELVYGSQLPHREACEGRICTPRTGVLCGLVGQGYGPGPIAGRMPSNIPWIGRRDLGGGAIVFAVAPSPSEAAKARDGAK